MNSIHSHLLPVNTRVRYSDNATRKDRDAYLSQGKASLRSAYQQHYEKERAKRGVITEIVSPTDGRAPFYVVDWGNGSISQSATWMIEKA